MQHKGFAISNHEIMQRRARVDANQKEIVTELRKRGFSVLHTHQLKGCFDILVGVGGRNFAFEIKDPSKPKSARKLTDGEQLFFDQWQGQVNVALTVEDVLRVVRNSA